MVRARPPHLAALTALGVATGISALTNDAGFLASRGTFSVSHLKGGGTPTASAGTNVSSATVSGSDVAGQVNFTIGTALAGAQTVVTVNFATAYTTAPHCAMFAAHTNAANAQGDLYISGSTPSTLVVAASSSMSARPYAVNYVCVQ